MFYLCLTNKKQEVNDEENKENKENEFGGAKYIHIHQNIIINVILN